MRNLWVFILKYNNFFLFILFFSIAFILVVRNNSYQRASTFNSSNHLIASIYAYVDNFEQYIHLKDNNKLLLEENAKLREQLKSSQYSKRIEKDSIADSVNQLQYTYMVARVINNSTHQKNNYLTINRGSVQGVKKGMGVISPNGIVGIILNVSAHFATVQSLLHADTRISASLSESNNFGSLIWGSGNYNPSIAELKDIPNHVKVEPNEDVLTSGYSLFPPGIAIGKVISSELSGDSFLDIKVRLNADFNSLQYVYVITDNMHDEREALESLNSTNE